MSGPNSAGELHPIDDDLLRHNRHVLAERLRWPDGALEACDRIADACPDWLPTWEEGSAIKGFERPAGFYASRKNRRYDEPSAYGEDPTALVIAISTWPYGDGFGGYRSWDPSPVRRFRCLGTVAGVEADCGRTDPHLEHPIDLWPPGPLTSG